MNAYISRKIKLTGSLVMLISAICLLNVGCQDPPEYPYEYEPGPPPDPPAFTSPLPDTTYNGDMVVVLFAWTSIDEAECYNLDLDTVSTYATDTVILVQGTAVSQTLVRTKAVTTYYCRIRAGSRKWTYYTDWSETRKLFIKPDLQ
jgi:hypothetical protein